MLQCVPFPEFQQAIVRSGDAAQDTPHLFILLLNLLHPSFKLLGLRFGGHAAFNAALEFGIVFLIA